MIQEFTNTPYDKLEVGMEAERKRLVLADDLYVFANSSGNLNPLHLPREDGDGDGLPEAVTPSMWLAAQISAVFGNQLPGPGTLYRSQDLEFCGRAFAGDEVVTKVVLTAKEPDRVARFHTTVTRVSDGAVIVRGEATVFAPEHPQSFKADDIPGLTVRRHKHFDALIDLAGPLPAIPTAVVAPEEANSLGGALLGWDHTLITPILIGDPLKIAAAAEEIGRDISGLEIIAEPDHAKAAKLGVSLVHEGRAQAVMKGHLHTGQLLGAVFAREGGLRTGRQISHVFVMDVPGLEHLLLITDAAINIMPDLETKVDIVQNAIDLAHTLGIAEPKVGILSAVETVNPKIPSTIDAAVLSKMADRGQIKGGLVDGPLAMDNAIDVDAAKTKGIKGLVAGRAEILVAPNMEAGNMLAKELTFVAHAEAGGIVIGAAVPVILTSRADDDAARLASCAVAALYQSNRKP
ncbi:bifunctional enoyl-CoA hydratase/phosphate acetyltransferase [Vannielia litorea]|uniref:bifunctional enoyl-CoA hydratase/phosphate acetyltransferase n=1 Tax=Vannielia litorea TaxID=1217970 RepID=UPI001C985D1E|nr:bifunctional enoyl-CoA hydratase/phosphate acetyltransferase [Vannielia litorea]MBY6046759.1 bifunctional enoyl-CoA hydratase/phosphate acetyltransferase [Vannielia litorea]MBY6074173.1 bifunctional enoyl-CoA hydratase/phosphate acetyltransferase [Vannielia litorea]